MSMERKVDSRVLSAKDLAQILGISPRWVHERLGREKCKYKTVPGLGRGGQGKLYCVDSLPTDWREKVCGSPEPDDGSDAAFDEARIRQRLTTLDRASLEERALASAKEEIVLACREYVRKSSKTGGKAQGRFRRAYLARSSFIGVSEETFKLVSTLGRSKLYNMLRAYDKHGIFAFLPKKGRGRSGISRGVEEYILGVIDGMPHARASDIFRFGQTNYSGSWPSESTIRRHVRRLRLKHKRVMKYRSHPDGWKSEYLVSYGNQSSAKFLLHRVQLDTTSVELRFESGKRLTLAAAYDEYSKWFKALLVPSASAWAECILLRHLILEVGVPYLVRPDHGRDYSSKHFIQVCDVLGIVRTPPPPFTPEGKGGVERLIQTIELEALAPLDQYLGPNVQARQQIRNRRSFAQRFSSKEPLEVPFSEEEVQKILDDWRLVYLGRGHRGLKGLSPAQKMAQSPRPARKIKDPRVLDVLLAPGGQRSILKDGIHFNSGVYVPLELAGRVGDRVFVRHDLCDLGRVFVFDLDGRFLCVAEDSRIAGITWQQAKEARRLQREQIRKEARAMRVLGESVGDFFGDYLEAKRNEPGQVKPMPFEVDFENDAIREAARAVEKRMEQEEEERLSLSEAAAGTHGIFNSFLREHERTREKLPPLRLSLVRNSHDEI